MCGRARCTLHAGQVAAACGFGIVGGGGAGDGGCPIPTVQMDRYRPSYNVSPGFYVPVVAAAALREETGVGEEGQAAAPSVAVHCMKWGLVPSFTKKDEKPDHYRMFNARSESIKEKPSFRRLIPHGRCLVAVEGFYEWKKDGSQKQPYYIHFKDQRPLVFAAMYDSWENHEGEVLNTFTILTTCSSSSLRWLHDRMPVILGSKDSIDMWLGKSTPGIETLLRPYEDPDLVWYPVTPAMGKVAFDGPECIKEIQLKLSSNNQISKFFSKKIGQKALDSRAGHLESPGEEPEENQEPAAERGHSGDSDPFSAVEKETAGASSAAADVVGSKRDFGELVADSGSMEKESKEDSLPYSPARKRDAKDPGDKQPTLLSFFGKK